MSIKAIGTSLKLTFEGYNQLNYPKTWFFVFVVAICVITQMNYLDKVCNLLNSSDLKTHGSKGITDRPLLYIL